MSKDIWKKYGRQTCCGSDLIPGQRRKVLNDLPWTDAEGEGKRNSTYEEWSRLCFKENGRHFFSYLTRLGLMLTAIPDL